MAGGVGPSLIVMERLALRDGFGENALRFGELPLADERAAEVIEEGRIARVGRSQSAVQRLCLRRVPGDEKQMREEAGKSRVGGSGRIGRAELLQKVQSVCGFLFGGVESGCLGDQPRVIRVHGKRGGEQGVGFGQLPPPLEQAGKFNSGRYIARILREGVAKGGFRVGWVGGGPG